jgi:hypothetical protein
MTSGAGAPRAFLKRSSGPIERRRRARDVEAEEHRPAEEVLLADALAVRLILSRMEQAVEQGVGERLP